MFYDWLKTNTYEQTLRVDGFRQHELNIINPSYPNPGDAGGTTPPTNRYLLADDLQMQRNFRLSAGVRSRGHADGARRTSPTRTRAART